MQDTSIRTSVELRDRLQAIAEPGEKLEDTIQRLYDRYQAAITRDRLAAQARVERAATNPAAVARPDAEAARLAELLGRGPQTA